MTRKINVMPLSDHTATC